MNGFLMLLIKGYFGKAKIYPCEIKWDIKANNFLIIFLSLIFLICVEPYKLGSCAIGATEKNQTVNSLISQGNRLFKEKNYKEAIPIIINLLENYEKAYSKANFREITYFRTRLAGYYRWIQKNPNKAIKQYSKLITYLETIKSKRNISFQIWLLMGEVYEKDLKEYEKAKHCYEKAIEQVTPDIKKDKASKAVIDWLKFLSEKTNILYLKNNQQFSKRILKYPSIDYLSFSFPYSAFSEISFIEEDFMNNSSSYYSIEKFEKLSTKYPNSYQLMSLGIVIFYHFLEEKDFKNALIVADRLFETYI